MSEPLIRRVNREQMLWRAVDVERFSDKLPFKSHSAPRPPQTPAASS